MENRVSSLDGLRGLTASSVVFSHPFLTSFPAIRNGASARTFEEAELLLSTVRSTPGRAGICSFVLFVISGCVRSGGCFASYEVSVLQKAAIAMFNQIEHGPWQQKRCLFKVQWEVNGAWQDKSPGLWELESLTSPLGDVTHSEAT